MVTTKTKAYLQNCKREKTKILEKSHVYTYSYINRLYISLHINVYIKKQHLFLLRNDDRLFKSNQVLFEKYKLGIYFAS